MKKGSITQGPAMTPSGVLSRPATHAPEQSRQRKVKLTITCDPHIVDAMRNAVGEDETVSRLVRRWLKAGAAAEGVHLGGD